MKRPAMLAIAAMLSACATDPAIRLERADAAIARVQTGYDTARSLALLFAPWLPPARAAQLHALAEAVEIALTTARHATDLATRRAALRRAETASAAYRRAAGA